MKRVQVAIGMIVRDGRYFLQRRDPEGAVLPGSLGQLVGRTHGSGQLAAAQLAGLLGGGQAICQSLGTGRACSNERQGVGFEAQ